MDAAIQMSDLKAGLGVVIKDSSGKIIGAAVQSIGYKGDVAGMEGEAVLYGIQVAKQAECVPFIVESNSLEVVELSLNRKGNMSETVWTIKEIQASLKNQIRLSIHFVPRLCNIIAHSLPKVALEYEYPFLLLEDFPPQIMLLLSKFI